MKLAGMILICLILMTTNVFAQGLPTEADLRAQIQKDTAPMSCADIVTIFTSETIPAAVALIKDPSSRAADEKVLAVVVLEEVSKQLKVKCVQ